MKNIRYVYIDRNSIESPTAEQIEYIRTEVLEGLHNICKLSESEIKGIIEKTDLLDYIRRSTEYFMHYGTYAVLEDIQEHLKKEYNIKIEIYEEN